MAAPLAAAAAILRLNDEAAAVAAAPGDKGANDAGAPTIRGRLLPVSAATAEGGASSAPDISAAALATSSITTVSRFLLKTNHRFRKENCLTDAVIGNFFPVFS